MAAVTPNFIGTASTAYAKTVGWTEENGNWYYYDSYGEAITDTWKKNGDDWYYLDSDGIRAADRQIDEYYVGEDGKRVSMKWVSVENEDFWDEDDAPEFLYYYYGRDGKALTSRWASINGSWYYFNEDGIMQTGSITVDGYNYYLGEDGSRKTGWILLADEPMIRNTLNHGTTSTIRASVLKMKLTRRLTASTTPLWTAACRQAGTSFPSRQQQSPAKPRQLPLPRLLLYLSRPLPAISTTMRTESALPAGEPLRRGRPQRGS